MNEQANKILADLLQKASNGIDAAVSFSQAQIPDVIHQLLVWNFTFSLITTVVAALTIPLLVWFLRSQLSRKQTGTIARGESYSWGEGKPKYRPTLMWDSKGELSPGAMLFGFIVPVWVLCIADRVLDLTWLKIWVAPKLYLIEYAAHLMK
ncbi:hypothetical protein [Pantoea stewartii]|uniref:Uncharacterized protein n=1 Tax=Pantoea stewartii subsp. stewartii DC283 TaxID=660596 RepID=H3R8Y9_PANSE|nr:hypothetical protein [Pantoea stewartii]ARF50802.1 hypothetical protein DSJ_16645 [Pantoea stewartii subsp. stewartii DC283]ARF51109.1 hypothetical protein DSJ_18505 [Pantoea stewartii subsp. stewartii DC283]EHU01652.1 hypothetical protein CKS_0085 [Pantoea stewartii subsp. stewartii DC283]KAB0555143.1 hypothetical protein F7Q90_10020 [Pantoea stewartii subsp. stewartii]